MVAPRPRRRSGSSRWPACAAGSRGATRAETSRSSPASFLRCIGRMAILPHPIENIARTCAASRAGSRRFRAALHKTCAFHAREACLDGAMLTAVVHAGANPSDLALTLSALVPAVAEGLMSHAVVVQERPDPACERIADAMGASLVTGSGDPWRQGAQAARGDWVLLLEAGEVPAPGWIAAIERHLMAHAATGRRPALLPAQGFIASLSERIHVALTGSAPRPGWSRRGPPLSAKKRPARPSGFRRGARGRRDEVPARSGERRHGQAASHHPHPEPRRRMAEQRGFCHPSTSSG